MSVENVDGTGSDRLGLYDECVAQLYALVLSAKLVDFRDDALTKLGELVPFDSAVWVSFRAYPQPKGMPLLDIHSQNVIGQDASVPFRFGTEFKEHDLVSQRAMATPGEPVCIEDTMPIEEYRRSYLYENFTRNVGIEYTMALAIGDVALNLWHGIVLWRAERDRPFSNDDKHFKRRFAHHMLNAWQQKQFLEISTEPAHARARGSILRTAGAITDVKGAICAADPYFGAIMAEHFPGWHGPDLPPEIGALITQKAASATVAALDIVLTRRDEFWHVVVRAPQHDLRLTPAEIDVAKLFAAGHSTSKIALLRNVSTATIRNQISSIYAKLAINSKVELINRLQ